MFYELQEIIVNISIRFITFALLVVASTVAPPVVPQPPQPAPELKLWTRYSEVVYAIEQCPGWKAGSPRTMEEWEPLFKTAAMLQSLDPLDVECALVAYMIMDQSRHGVEYHRYGWSKPMLLLRLMFDIPAGNEGLRSMRLLPCGGMPCESVEEIPVGERSRVSLPIEWSEDGPVIVVAPVVAVVNDLSHPYQPQTEFREMSKRFRKRDLSKWVPAATQRSE